MSDQCYLCNTRKRKIINLVCVDCRETYGAKPDDLIFKMTLIEDTTLIIPAATVKEAWEKVGRLRQVVTELNITFDHSSESPVTPSEFATWALYTPYECPIDYHCSFVMFDSPDSKFGVCDGHSERVYDFCWDDCNNCSERVKCLTVRKNNGTSKV